MKNLKISVIGLGYVGLPVAVAFGLRQKTIGFDVNDLRIKELKEGHDRNLEITQQELKDSDIIFSDSEDDLIESNFYIVTVPTPITDANVPDLSIVEKASHTVGRTLRKGDVVVYESTVYPGATEDICVPILEKESGLKLGADFKVGFSPERINPGDKNHTFTKLNKVVSGSDEDALNLIYDVYDSVVEADLFKAKSIKVAEAAKVIENTQRDINIAFMNELSIIFDKLDIDTTAVLEAARTKWNFLPFYPGLVGGHCIGVDPYYLTYKAEMVGYHPQIILSGRRINNSMGKRVAEQTIKKLIQAGHQIKNSTVTVLGLTFKENTPDIRNTRIIDIINELKDFGVNVKVHDPLAYKDEAEEEYGLTLMDYKDLGKSEAVLFAVAHKELEKVDFSELKNLMKDEKSVFINVRSHFRKEDFKGTNISTWFL